jgi:predicted metal-dependent phosphoesterase TrpH
MDADWEGLEVHILGFGFDRTNRPLLNHLEHVRKARIERTRREIALVNERLGAGTLSVEQVFAPGRETLMRPHLIRPLVEQGRFSSYEEAQTWLRANVNAGVTVTKPPVGDAIALLKGAGGWTVLAHPAYYVKAGHGVAEGLPSLARMGLDGIELDYPYASCSPAQFTREDETRMAAGLRAVGEAVGLRFTRGSDCHNAGDFDRVYGPPS